MRDFFVVFPGLIIGIYTVFLATVDSIGNYIKSDEFQKNRTAGQRERYIKKVKFFLDNRFYFSMSTGIILILSFIFWLFFQFSSVSQEQPSQKPVKQEVSKLVVTPKDTAKIMFRKHENPKQIPKK
ncbi:MAG: hypothetical protein WCP08_16415 [Prolixibacteraceae bacterium]